MSYIRVHDHIQRKADHINNALHGDVEYHTVKPGFEKYSFTYEALPEINLSDVDTSTTLFNKHLKLPLIISSMTGGTPEASELNKRLAEAAQDFGLAMGVGSQRVALADDNLADTYRVRDVAPDILLFANLGAVQLNNSHSIDYCKKAVEMIGADAIFLHLNPLQEAIQVGGNTNFSGIAGQIEKVCKALEIPVLVKEVGHGISENTAAMLVNAGVSGIDVAGAGGTSWARVEAERNIDQSLSALGLAMAEWGIPTADSLISVRGIAPEIIVIASGGVRSGEDIAKSIAFGADAAGMALPFLKAANQSQDDISALIQRLHRELATVMFCTGSRRLADLSMSIHKT